jgi:hypothetical protein
MNENVPAIADVAPACTRIDQFGERADAYPPRRIVEVAKGMGPNASLQSICQDDFGPAMDGIIELAKSHLQVECLSRDLHRDGHGKVDCELIWELPPEVGSDCSSYPYLSDVSKPRSKTNDRGGRDCKVAQLPVGSTKVVPKGDGFYYDDFSEERVIDCRDGASTRISYSASVEVPQGVRAFLDCSN